MTIVLRVHGGTDADDAPHFDFSTNSNACGPCPHAFAAVRAADATRYPDPAYTALRASLAVMHGVEPGRIVVAASASAFIFCFTAWAAHQGAGSYWRTDHAYGDYASAAEAWNLQRTSDIDGAGLVWACEPSSPLGQTHPRWPRWMSGAAPDVDAPAPASARPVVLDCAYAPMRLSGAPGLDAARRDQVWQLWSPNKSLGLTGVRAAFAVAPLGSGHVVAQLEALAASWPVGAHGVALLHAWTQHASQAWLHQSLQTLVQWKAEQIGTLERLGWECLPSDANFFCARAPSALDVSPFLRHLRAAGVHLRDAASFGLAGHVRLSVQPPSAQAALRDAIAGYCSGQAKVCQ